MSSPSLQDLSGKVRKTEKYYFANGGLADIWRGEWSTGDSTQIVAVKVIRSVWSTEHLKYLKIKFLQEAKVWSQLDDPNITPFFGVCFDFGTPLAPCLVSPYYSNGNVAQFLQKHPKSDRMQSVIQVASGLAYLHRQKIIHGDIKASNILVNDNQDACISDFGLSRMLEATGFTTKSIGGTCRWMARELIAPADDEDDSTPRVTTESDVWAFAMTVLEILSSRFPYANIKFDAAVLLAIMKGGRPPHKTYPEISDGVWSLLESCWDVDPDNRPTMESLAQQFGQMQPTESCTRRHVPSDAHLIEREGDSCFSPVY